MLIHGPYRWMYTHLLHLVYLIRAHPHDSVRAGSLLQTASSQILHTLSSVIAPIHPTTFLLHQRAKSILSISDANHRYDWHVDILFFKIIYGCFRKSFKILWATQIEQDIYQVWVQYRLSIKEIWHILYTFTKFVPYQIWSNHGLEINYFITDTSIISRNYGIYMIQTYISPFFSK